MLEEKEGEHRERSRSGSKGKKKADKNADPNFKGKAATPSKRVRLSFKEYDDYLELTTDKLIGNYVNIEVTLKPKVDGEDSELRHFNIDEIQKIVLNKKPLTQ